MSYLRIPPNTNATNATRPLDPISTWSNGITVNDFQTTLQQAIDSFSPQRTILPHKQVRALCLLWSEDDLECAKEVNLMSEILAQYGYQVRTARIPANAGDRRVTEWLVGQFQNLSNGLGKDDLAIVYYCGHGLRESINMGGPCVWRSGEFPTSRGLTNTSVSFSLVRSATLDLATVDVLYLLDCCNAATGAVQGRKSVLAACGVELKAIGAGKRSFSMGVIGELENAYRTKKYLNISSLHNRLLTQVFRGEIQNTPIASEMYNDLDRSSIYLLPIGQATATYPNNIPVGTRPPQGVAVVLSVELCDAGPQTLTHLKQWLNQNVPANIHKIRVESMEFLTLTQTMSGLLLMKLDAAVWHCLCSHAAIKFLGYSRLWYAP